MRHDFNVLIPFSGPSGLSHPNSDDPTYYTTKDPSIIIENDIREEHGYGYRVGDDRSGTNEDAQLRKTTPDLK